MNRREFIKLTTASAMTLTLSHCSYESERDKLKKAAPKDAPNVLFIVIDDLNDWIGCMGGHPDVKTPHLDRLAQRGVLFTNAHCTASLCNPSRVSVLTGLQPSTTGVYDNSQPFRLARPEAVTLPQHFMAHGYCVSGAGKIFHISRPDPDSWNDPGSWHKYFPSKLKEIKSDDPALKVPLSDKLSTDNYYAWGAVDLEDDEIVDGIFTNWAVEVLGQKHDNPFFLGLGLIRPHLPWYVPRKYFEIYSPDKVTLPNVNEDDLDDVPPICKQNVNSEVLKKIIKSNQWKLAVSGYLASISFADAMIGKILDALDASPYAENTMIVLWSDHGYHLGEKLHWGKFTLWEEATNVPLIFVAPGITEVGGRCTRSVSLLDIYPTLIDLCGLASRDELEGRSLLPLLKDPSAAWNYPAITTIPRPRSHSVRSERWRYSRYNDGTEELYDHEVDELEWTNLATRPEYAVVKEELAQWLPKVNAPAAPTKSSKSIFRIFQN